MGKIERYDIDVADLLLTLGIEKCVRIEMVVETADGEAFLDMSGAALHLTVLGGQPSHTVRAWIDIKDSRKLQVDSEIQLMGSCAWRGRERVVGRTPTNTGWWTINESGNVRLLLDRYVNKHGVKALVESE